MNTLCAEHHEIYDSATPVPGELEVLALLAELRIDEVPTASDVRLGIRNADGEIRLMLVFTALLELTAVEAVLERMEFALDPGGEVSNARGTRYHFFRGHHLDFVFRPTRTSPA